MIRFLLKERRIKRKDILSCEPIADIRDEFPGLGKLFFGRKKRLRDGYMRAWQTRLDKRPTSLRIDFLDGSTPSIVYVTTDEPEELCHLLDFGHPMRNLRTYQEPAQTARPAEKGGRVRCHGSNTGRGGRHGNRDVQVDQRRLLLTRQPERDATRSRSTKWSDRYRRIATCTRLFRRSTRG